MKITVAKSDLEPALSLAAAGMNAKGGDISGHFLFRPHEKGVQVLAWNGRLGASSTFMATVEEEEGLFTVEGWRLRKWVGAAGDVTLTLSESDGKVTIKSPKSRGTLRSLDPDNFQFWDDTLEASVSAGKVSAKALKDALTNAKNFVWEKDTQSPEYSVCEAREGVILTSDRQALSVSVVPGLNKKASFRIHHKDIPTVVGYLGGAGNDEVELLEHDHVLFLKLNDNQILVVGKPNTKFPSIRYDPGDEDAIQWTISKDEVLSGIDQLSATAETSDVKLRFRYDKKRGKVLMSMKSLEGTNDEVPLEVRDFKEDTDFLKGKIRAMAEAVNKDEISKMDKKEAADFIEKETAKTSKKALDVFYDAGCVINYEHLQKVLAGYKDDDVRFGVGPMGRGGFIRFKNVRETEELEVKDASNKVVKKTVETDVFLTMLAWIRDLTK